MLPWERLRDKILTLEGKPLQAARALEGEYRFERFVLALDRVTAEPPGAPSAMRVRVDMAEARFPPGLWSTRPGRIALEDFLARRWLDAARRVARARGVRPAFAISVGEQEILERTACRLAEDYVEVRGTVVLPTEGRRLASKALQALFVDDLPQVVEGSLLYPNLNPSAVQRHCEAVEDYEAMRTELSVHNLVAFLADGAVLPRDPATDRPLLSRLVPLEAPRELRVTLTPPHRGPVTGLGIPRGVTVVLGHPLSGRSTFLRAVAAAVYPHLPGDGREYCVTVPDAVLVRADPGRRVEGVDVSAFVERLPGGQDPRRLRTESASDALAMAASVMEALEAGCSLLLVDEDTAAAALMGRDALWAEIAPEAARPVVSLAEVLRPLYEEHGVSSIVVTTRGAEYVPVADTVIALDEFRPRVVTAQAKQAAPAARPPRARFGGVHHRIPLPDSLAPLRGRRPRVESADGLRLPRRAIPLGPHTVDLSAVEQLVDPAQARAIAAALVFAADRGLADGARTIREILGLIEMEIARAGLEVLVPDGPAGDLALPRRHELAAALNRLRTLRVK
ncbi:MAG: ABC-ATPase domain-containing protein [Armatimonadota bacterium]|nr:ABC-ATPase domain-containing protein [Armatimonadota bacterium]MDR7403697.1 ABC-ATPase domain-containing protein [Armatimonadota bacterium]MDR7588646.1 ABC-ATPase domain-containing protein [Armatimonadota bacterium]MDR7613029.1 ABC-ATPase domain-containing protein [Armatimonadota bacterium]